MKWNSLLLLLVSISTHTLSAAPAPDPIPQNPDARPQIPAPTITARGPDHKVWTRTTTQIGPGGRAVERQSSYTELATGLHYWKEGQWVDAQPVFELRPEGYVARQCRHHVALAQSRVGECERSG